MIQSKLNEATSNDKIDMKEFNKEIDQYRYAYGRQIQIEQLPSYGAICPGFGINWSAIGVQTVKETRDFMKRMEAAVRDVEYLNKKYQGKEYDF